MAAAFLQDSSCVHGCGDCADCHKESSSHAKDTFWYGTSHVVLGGLVSCNCTMSRFACGGIKHDSSSMIINHPSLASAIRLKNHRIGYQPVVRAHLQLTRVSTSLAHAGAYDLASLCACTSRVQQVNEPQLSDAEQMRCLVACASPHTSHLMAKSIENLRCPAHVVMCNEVTFDKRVNADVWDGRCCFKGVKTVTTWWWDP